VDQFDYDLPGELIDGYEARGVHSAALARGRGETHVWLLTFAPGGEIGAHVAGFDQLFFVLAGTAWVEFPGHRLELVSGQGATIDLGETHAKGSDDGATVLMVQVSSLEYPRQ
jgi:quercetin dioxygenase-like cupin family protein